MSLTNRLESARASRTLVLLLGTVALFADLLTYDMVVPFLPSYLRKWDTSELVIGAFFGAYPFALILALPLVACLCDRAGPRLPVLLGVFGLLGSTMLSAAANSFAVLFLARLVQGVAGAATWTGCLAMIARVYPATMRGWALGTAMSGMSLGTLFGPPLGGVLFEWGGYTLPFHCASCLALLVGIGLLIFLPRTSGQNRPGRELPAPLFDRRYFVTAGTIVVGSTLLSMLEPILPLHLADRLQVGPAAIGFLFGLATLAYAISSPLAGALSDRWGRRRTMALGLAASAIALPLASLQVTWLAEACALVPVGIGCAFLLSPTLPELAETADRQGGTGYGTAYALSNTAYALGMVLGPLSGGLLTQEVGVPLTLTIASLAAMLYLPVLVVTSRRREVCPRETQNLAA